MKTERRAYRMTARAESAAATRDRIIDAAIEQFLAAWYDEVTLAGIARTAGVSQQTVVNHFGSKERLLEQAIDRWGPDRSRSGEGGDPVLRVLEDYERGGDAMVRLLALGGRVPAVAPFLARGRAGHRAWVERAFADRLPAEPGPARERAIDGHVAALDVYLWKLLRRDLGRSLEET